MKKIFVILLLLVYGVSSPGATLYVHYCCGKIDKVHFNSSKQTDCPFGKNISRKNCCADKQIELKVKSDYKAETSTSIFLKNIAAFAGLTHDAFKERFFINNKPFHFSDVSPPLAASVPVYIFDCTYLI